MASALQKIFRKRISKQQVQEQRQKQEAAASSEIERNQPFTRLGSAASQPYLTVSSLNSPSSSTSRFAFSSKASLDLYATSGSGPEIESTNYLQQVGRMSREDSRGGSSFRLDGRPRAATVNSHLMLRDYCGNIGGSSTTERELQVDQFGALLAVDRDSSVQTHGKEENEEEELDSNPTYDAISQRSDLLQDWNMAKLVLIPSKQQRIEAREMESSDYLSLHALLPSHLFKDQFVSVRSTLPQRGNDSSITNAWKDVTSTVTLKTESRSVHILITRPANALVEAIRWEHTVSVLSETTIYRSTNLPDSTNMNRTSSFRGSKLNSTSTRKERIQIRVLTIDGLFVPTAFLDLLYSGLESSPTRMTRKQTERRASGQASGFPTEGAIAFPVGSPQLSSFTDSSPPTSPQLPQVENSQGSCLIPLRRQFLADFAFLLDPPKELDLLQRPLQEALETLVRAANEFTNAYVYVSGFDAYNVSRIRRGILSKAWQAFESCRINKDENVPEYPSDVLGQEGRAHLLLLLENVVMGYCHGKIYSSIRTVYREADEAVDNVVYTYQELQVSLEDLSVGMTGLCNRPDVLERAIFIMKHLGDADEDLEHLLNGAVTPNQIRGLAKQGDLVQADGVIYSPEKNRSRIRTPLDVFDVLHATLEEIGSAVTKSQKGDHRSSLGTDELLPILAYVIIRAGPMKLVSLFYYIRQFGLSDAISSQLNWALTTHDAVIEYLRRDPLQLCCTTTKSAGSSLRAQSPPCSTPRTPSFRYETIGDKTTMMEPSLSSDSNERRVRRSSLPSSVMLSSTTCSDFTDFLESKKSPRITSKLPVISKDYESGEKGNTPEEIVFKIPGRPASSYGATPRARVMSALDVVGEDGVASESGRESPIYAGPGSLMSRSSSTSRRTNSMSGSVDLLIRPQIVVRPKRNTSHSFVEPSEATPSLRVPLRRAKSIKEDEQVTKEAGGVKMNRAGSEELSLHRPGMSKSSSSAVQVPRQNRRKSLDSWNAFSFFGGASSFLSTPQEESKPTTTDISPSNSCQGCSPGVTPSSPPSTWLSSWTSDWGQSRKGSISSGHSPGQVLADNGNVALRSASTISNESAAQLKEWTFPPSLSSSSSNLIIGQNSSLGSIKYHDSNQTLSDLTTSTNRNMKKTASIKSTSSSGHSHHYNTHHQQARSDDAHTSERKHRPSRSRLLSISSPTEPLPPRLYPESAAADYFQVTASSSSSHIVNLYNNSHYLSKVLDASFTSQDGHLYSNIPSATTATATSSRIDQLTPRSFTSFDGNSSNYFSHHHLPTKIQIPSPVDEISDPMAKVNVS